MFMMGGGGSVMFSVREQHCSFSGNAISRPMLDLFYELLDIWMVARKRKTSFCSLNTCQGFLS